jgi:hypothetical protein
VSIELYYSSARQAGQAALEARLGHVWLKPEPAWVTLLSGVGVKRWRLVFDRAAATADAGRFGIIVSVCGWCSRLQGEKPGEGISGVSDGICPDCADDFRNSHEPQTPKD